MARRLRKALLGALIVGFVLAAACAVTDTPVVAQSFIMSKGCLSGTDSTTASIITGYSTWYTAESGVGHGFDGPTGAFHYVTVVAFPDNTGDVYVTRYLLGQSYTDIFGPGGGFADFCVCDSIRILKTATDIVSYKLCP